MQEDSHNNNNKEEGLKKRLGAEVFHVAREKGTEAPFSGAYVNHHEQGMYRCKVCGAELFSSKAKFDSGTGWPSFADPMNLELIELKEDTSLGMVRIEVLCKRCGSHLGHVFNDGPKEMGGKRFCINSVCLDFEHKKEHNGTHEK